MKIWVNSAGNICVEGTAKEWTDVCGYAWRAKEGPAERDVLMCVWNSLEMWSRDGIEVVEERGEV